MIFYDAKNNLLFIAVLKGVGNEVYIDGKRYYELLDGLLQLLAPVTRAQDNETLITNLDFIGFLE